MSVHNTIIDHGNAKVEKLGYKWFGCSVCGYNCYSKKWVKEHIQEIVRMQICEAGLEFGWFNHSEAEDKCENCWVKEACEAFKLKRDIAFMELESKIFLHNSNIQPLMGITEYVKRYESKKERLNELLEGKIR